MDFHGFDALLPSEIAAKAEDIGAGAAQHVEDDGEPDRPAHSRTGLEPYITRILAGTPSISISALRHE